MCSLVICHWFWTLVQFSDVEFDCACIHCHWSLDDRSITWRFSLVWRALALASDFSNYASRRRSFDWTVGLFERQPWLSNRRLELYKSFSVLTAPTSHKRSASWRVSVGENLISNAIICYSISLIYSSDRPTDKSSHRELTG